MFFLVLFIILISLFSIISLSDDLPTVDEIAVTKDVTIPLSYPLVGGSVWVPKEVQSGRAYPVFLILSDGSGANAFVGDGTRHLERKVRELIDQDRMHPTILVAPSIDFTSNDFNLNELLAKTNSLISSYGVSVNRDLVGVAGYSEGAVWSDASPGDIGVYAIAGDETAKPLHSVAIIDGTFTESSAKFLHEHLDNTETRVIALIGKNRPESNAFADSFIGNVVECGVNFDSTFFSDCKRSSEWYLYTTIKGGPSDCDKSPNPLTCKNDNVYVHSTIQWRFFDEWLPMLYPITLQPVEKKVVEVSNTTTVSQGVVKQGFRFVVLGDTHTTQAPTDLQKNLINKVVELKPSFVISAGDMIDSEKDTPTDTITKRWSYFDDFIKPITDAGIPFLPTAGNHDSELGSSALRTSYNSKWSSHTTPGLTITGDLNKYYSFNYPDAEGTHFSILYAAKVSIDNTQLGWLENDLKTAENAKIKFVVGHVPLKNAREPVTNKVHTGEMVNINKITSVLNTGKVSAYFAGHNHVYHELDVGGITQISSGVTQYYKNNGVPLGGSDVQVDQNIMVVDVVGDQFTYYVLVGPDFDKTADGRTIPVEPPSSQQILQPPTTVPGTIPTITGMPGLYDYFFSSDKGLLVMRAIARYPLGIGVDFDGKESIISVTPPVTPTDSSAKPSGNNNVGIYLSDKEPEFIRVAKVFKTDYSADIHPATNAQEILDGIYKHNQISRLVFFGHGTSRSFLKPGAAGVTVNVNKDNLPTMMSVDRLAKELAPRLEENAIIGLAACSAGSNPGEVPSGQHGNKALWPGFLGAGGEDSFAAKLRDALAAQPNIAKGVRVRAHVTLGHTTNNPFAREFLVDPSQIGQPGYAVIDQNWGADAHVSRSDEWVRSFKGELATNWIQGGDYAVS